MKAKLVLVAGKADKGEVRLKLPTIIGRTRDAGLMIAHKTVSRRHCELFERHGMLYVRDSGSLNGTLVDDAPIKESMLKPGHTVTVGPLTFRAEYEPADAFLGGDEPDDALNGVADTATGMTNAGISESNRTAAMPTFNGQFDDSHADDAGASAALENGAAEDVLDFGSEAPGEAALDFGGDETLSMEIAEETTDLGSLDSPAGMPALESSEFDASEFTPTDPAVDGLATIEDDLDVAFSLDDVDTASTEPVHVESSDDLALDFGEDAAAPQASAEAPAMEPAAESSDFDLDLGDELSIEPAGETTSEPAGAATGDVDDLLPAGGDDFSLDEADSDDASFDFLSDDAPAAGATTDAGSDEEFSLAGDDGDFDLEPPGPATAGAAAAAEFDEDDGGTFDLADDSPVAATEAAATEESEALDFGSDDEATFDFADSAEEPEPAADSAAPTAKKKPADEDDEMSDFLKELGM